MHGMPDATVVASTSIQHFPCTTLKYLAIPTGRPGRSILSTNYRPPSNLTLYNGQGKFSRLSLSIVLAKNFTGETGTVEKINIARGTTDPGY